MILLSSPASEQARNDGGGGADFYDQVGCRTEAEVNDWLKENRPPRTFGEFRYDHDLEVEVSDLLARELEQRRLKRLLRTNLIIGSHKRERCIDSVRAFWPIARKQRSNLRAAPV